MVNAEEELLVRPLPLGVALAWWKPQNLQKMSIWISKIEGFNAAGVRVPVRQALRPGGRVLHLVRSQHGVRLVHVAHDDRDMLEPPILTA